MGVLGLRDGVGRFACGVRVLGVAWDSRGLGGSRGSERNLGAGKKWKVHGVDCLRLATFEGSKA